MNLLSKIQFTWFIMCLSVSIHARETVLITYEHNRDQALLIQKILKREVHLPEALIKLRYQKRPCEAREASIVQICVKKNKEMDFAHFNQEVVQRSLSVFWEGKI